MNFTPEQLMQLAGIGGAKTQVQPLITFKSGMMDFDGRTVTPKRGKGILRLINDEANACKTLEWCDAETKKVNQSWYIMEGEAKFEKAKQSKDRVYLLEFH